MAILNKDTSIGGIEVYPFLENTVVGGGSATYYEVAVDTTDFETNVEELLWTINNFDPTKQKVLIYDRFTSDFTGVTETWYPMPLDTNVEGRYSSSSGTWYYLKVKSNGEICATNVNDKIGAKPVGSSQRTYILKVIVMSMGNTTNYSRQ